MSAATTFGMPDLAVTSAEDNMELGSDYGNADGDIDLDFYLEEDAGQDEDLVLDDARSVAGRTPQNHDHNMEEPENDGSAGDGQHDNASIPDVHLTDASEIALDDTFMAIHSEPNVQQHDNIVDEDLIDYSDDEEEVAVVISQDHNDGSALEQVENDYEKSLDETAGRSAHGNQDVAQELSSPQIVSTITAASGDRSPSRTVSADDQGDNEHTEGQSTETGEADIAQTVENVPDTYQSPNLPAQETQHHEYAQGKVANHSPSEEVNDEEYIDNEDNAPMPKSPLHPITVEFEGYEAYLFQMNLHDDYLFPSEQEFIATKDLNAFFKVLRDEMISKGSLTDAEELAMDLPSLHLTYREVDSFLCQDTTLAELVDIYQLLQDQDGFKDPPPFPIYLYREERVSVRLDRLRVNASEGRGTKDLEFFLTQEEHDPQQDWSSDYDGYPNDDYYDGQSGAHPDDQPDDHFDENPEAQYDQSVAYRNDQADGYADANPVDEYNQAGAYQDDQADDYVDGNPGDQEGTQDDVDGNSGDQDDAQNDVDGNSGDEDGTHDDVDGNLGDQDGTQDDADGNPDDQDSLEDDDGGYPSEEDAARSPQGAKICATPLQNVGDDRQPAWTEGDGGESDAFKSGETEDRSAKTQPDDIIEPLSKQVEEEDQINYEDEDYISYEDDEGANVDHKAEVHPRDASKPMQPENEKAAVTSPEEEYLIDFSDDEEDAPVAPKPQSQTHLNQSVSSHSVKRSLSDSEDGTDHLDGSQGAKRARPS
ncbi:hypothetical protein GQ43DRAFT_470861 [Delitschia confertaspora ATCC 74209]|uniref:Uncharacterized protein n=1 Tax=Delitschia confertaspora ATCC 74209 TaxID=1513339 RepID=A0A9P4JNT0_9PLEO|nr:hypothetical protein GQ43DRAFT_470861 [Delitschia confertaspora ATCC 74209]